MRGADLALVTEFVRELPDGSTHSSETAGRGFLEDSNSG
jgi:hypothetical protein